MGFTKKKSFLINIGFEIDFLCAVCPWMNINVTMHKWKLVVQGRFTAFTSYIAIVAHWTLSPLHKVVWSYEDEITRGSYYLSNFKSVCVISFDCIFSAIQSQPITTIFLITHHQYVIKMFFVSKRVLHSFHSSNRKRFCVHEAILKHPKKV